MGMKAYPTYKDSGAPWLGNIPAHWTARKIKTLFRIKKEIAGKEGFDVLSITQQGIKVKNVESNEGQIAQSYTNYQLLNVGEFAMNHMDLLTGWVDISPFNGVTSPDYRVFVRTEENALSKYLLYTLQTCYSRRLFYGLAQGVSSIGRCRLQSSKFKNFVFPLPQTIEEQNAIVAYLDKKCAEIDELVSRRQAIIDRLKELKQSIIADAVTKGLNPDVPMKDSGIAWIGDIPQHWEIRRFANEFLERRTKVSDQDYPPISVTKQGILPQLEKVAKTDNGDNRKLVRVGDFVINSRSDRKGSSGLSAYEGSVSLINHVLIPAPSWNRLFVHNLLRSVPFQEEFYKKGHGIVADLWTTRYSDIASSYIPFPPTDEQQAIAIYLDKKCSDIDELVARQEQIIEKLKELKTSTIAHVVTGKVDVRDAI